MRNTNSLSSTRVCYEDLDVSIIEFTDCKENLPDSALYPKKSMHCELVFVKRGRMVYYLDNKTQILNTGDFLFIPKGANRHAYSDNKSYLHSYIMALNYRLKDGTSTDLPLQTLFNVKQNIFLEELYEKLARLWREKSKGYRLLSRAIALQIFHELIFRTENPSITEGESKRIDIIKDYINRNFNRDISVEEVADLLNLNPNYVGSYFKKKTGYTLRQYANSVRIKEAKNLLSTGKYSVSGVAEHCGYQDIYYFSKVFKQFEGVPPSAFIK